MRLVMTLLVRDEADVVADMLDHHLARGVDHVVATDNGSRDGTVEILERYRDRGALTLLHEAGTDYRQSAWVTRMARLAAAEHGADWVINADADEFYRPADATDLRDVLAAVPERFGVLVTPVRNFRPSPTEDGPWHRRMTVRETLSVKPGGGRLFVNVVHRAAPDVVVGMGNHSATGTGLTPMPGWRPIECLHAPMRALARYERKIAGGGQTFKPWLAPEQLTPEAARAAYLALATDERDAVAGIRAGSLVVDRRLTAELDAIRAGGGVPAPAPPEGGGALAWPDLPPAVAELRAQAMRAAFERTASPEHDAMHQLRGGLDLLPGHLRRRVAERRQRR